MLIVSELLTTFAVLAVSDGGLRAYVPRSYMALSGTSNFHRRNLIKALASDVFTGD